jgi:pimeloyl-ACP methyl ester carboxylesterase
MSTWVLLRGLMRETRHWGEFPMLFQNVTGAENVVTLDFPGNGRLHAQASPASVSEMANHCRLQLTQLGYAPPYRVLALSLGAMAAVEWSARHPAEIDRLVLINTSLAPHNPFYQRLRPANYPALLRFLISGSVTRREALILRLTSTLDRSELQRARLLEQWASYARECPVTRSNILRQLQAAISYRAAQSKPPVPVLFLAAKQDRLVNAECSQTLAGKWNCPIRLHPSAGHDLPLDDGYWVAQQVREWLGSSGPAACT